MFNIFEITKKVLIHDSFYGSFLLGVNKYISNKIPTACVMPNGINIDMLFNESFMNSLNTDERIGVMIHQILHIVMFDLIKFDLFPDKAIMNIAMDICNNQYISEKYRSKYMLLPTSTEFKELDLPAFLSSKEYYDLLIKNKSKLPNYLLNNDFHSTWTNVDKNLLDAISKQIENKIKNVYEDYCAKSMDNIPSFLRNRITEIYDRNNNSIPWNTIVRSFRSFCDKQKVRLTNNRPNKRFPNNKAVSNQRKNKLMIGIDTSGSIDENMLSIFFSEIYNAYKTGAEILVVECDTKIGRSYVFKGKYHHLDSVTGGGGTCLSPMIKFYNKSDYNGLIVFTDGMLFDKWAQYSKPILWLVTNNNYVGKINFPGKQIFFNI